MKSNKGFIATSLIYTFFLAFVAILSALLANYISNKTILERFSEGVKDELNEPYYTVTLYATGADINGGIRYTNLIKPNPGVITLSPSYSKDLEFYDPNENDGDYYYISINHDDDSYAIETVTNGVQFSLPNDNVNGLIETVSSKKIAIFQKGGIDYKTPSYLRIENTSSSSTIMLNNLMMINLTQAYKENAPTNYFSLKTWLDSTLNYFEGTQSIKEIKVKKGENVEFILNSYIKYEDPSNPANNEYYKPIQKELNCNPDDPLDPKILSTDNTNSEKTKTWKINSVTKNLTCKITYTN